MQAACVQYSVKSDVKFKIGSIKVGLHALSDEIAFFVHRYNHIDSRCDQRTLTGQTTVEEIRSDATFLTAAGITNITRASIANSG
jgi:hypothetical protein